MWKIVLLVLSALFASAIGAFVGGYSTIDVNDSGAQNALNFAVVHHNKGTNDMYVYKPTKVIQVQRQLVSGYNYVINVIMERTNCRKGGATETCDIFRESPQSLECTFTVYTQPWTYTIEVTKESCQQTEQQEN